MILPNLDRLHTRQPYGLARYTVCFLLWCVRLCAQPCGIFSRIMSPFLFPVFLSARITVPSFYAGHHVPREGKRFTPRHGVTAAIREPARGTDKDSIAYHAQHEKVSSLRKALFSVFRGEFMYNTRRNRL